MIRANEPAYPVPLGAEEGLAVGMSPNGLTKREYFAGLAMQALISADVNDCLRSDLAAELSVLHADALLAELEKTS